MVYPKFSFVYCTCLLFGIVGGGPIPVRHLCLNFDPGFTLFLFSQNVFVKTEFVELAERLFKERSVEVHYEGVLPAALKHQRSVAEMVQFRMDPVGHLRLLLQDKSMVPSEVFHLNGPAHITKQDFTDTVRVSTQGVCYP